MVRRAGCGRVPRESNSGETFRAAGTIRIMSGYNPLIADGGETYSEDPGTGEWGEQVFLFSSFADEDEGLIMGYSDDLYNWEQIPGPHIDPSVGDEIMRDPFISMGPDGTYHMVWTSGWNRQDIGYAYSKDLVNWSEQRLLPVMEDYPTTVNCWAPKIFYDDEADQWQIAWSSWVEGMFEGPSPPETNKDHRIWYTTTDDFETVADPDILFNPGYSCIDAYLQAGDDEWLLFYKDGRYNKAHDLTPEHQNIRMARSKSRYGPFGFMTEPITGDNPEAKWKNEGACSIRVDGTYYVFYDQQYEHDYLGATRSDDLEEWEDVSDRMNCPPGFKHGHILRVPRRDVAALVE